MAQFTLGKNRLTSPPFIAEQFNETLLIPAGARLDTITPAATAGSFLAQVNGAPAGILKDNNGKIRIPAGVPVVRAAADGPAAANSFTVGAVQNVTTYTNANTANNLNPAPIPTAPVSGGSIGTFAKGFRLAVNGDFNADGSPVAATGEFYLTAFDVEDAANNPDIELIRGQTLIYINWLPFWPTPVAGLTIPVVQYDLFGNALNAAQLTAAAAVFWPANVQAALKRVYQITYGREVV